MNAHDLEEMERLRLAELEEEEPSPGDLMEQAVEKAIKEAEAEVMMFQNLPFRFFLPFMSKKIHPDSKAFDQGETVGVEVEAQTDFKTILLEVRGFLQA